MKMYENERFLITKGFFRGFRVIDKRAGYSVKPADSHTQQCVSVYVHLGQMGMPSNQLMIARDLMFYDYACLSTGFRDDGRSLDDFPLLKGSRPAAEDYCLMANDVLRGVR